MKYIYILIAVVVFWKIYSLISRGGNFHIIPRNITRTYKTLKRKFSDKYESRQQLLFLAGNINALLYTKKDKGLIKVIYDYASECADVDNEIDSLTFFCQMLMVEYLAKDTKKPISVIKESVLSMRDKIQKTIIEELDGSQYQDSLGENLIEIMNDNYSKLTEALNDSTNQE